MWRFEEEAFADPHDFVQALARSGRRWSADSDDRCSWVFRGQADADWELKPSGFREPLRPLLQAYRELEMRSKPADYWLGCVGRALQRPSGLTDPEWLDRVRDTSVLALAQARVVREFVSIANSAKHPLRYPIPLYQIFKLSADGLMENLLRYIEGTMIALTDREGYDTAVLFAVAQHHGVPTPLLDWTWNPLIAAYFAAEDIVLGRAPSSRELAVYAVHEDVIVRDKHISRITVPPGLVPFLDAQEGLFLWCPTYFSRYIETGLFSTFNSLFEETARDIVGPGTTTPLLQCLKLPAAKAPSLLKILWRDKLSPAHLRPTFDHVTRAIEVRSSWL